MDLIQNIEKIHTTPMGILRIKRNLCLVDCDVVEFCKNKIPHADEIICRGKNWYVCAGNSIITINAHSFTIITAHKQ